jgi:hypothetical protein
MPYAYVRAASGSGAPYTPADSVSVVVGDPWPGGARAALRFPYAPGCEELVAGESAELLVLCRDDGFQSFKVGGVGAGWWVGGGGGGAVRARAHPNPAPALPRAPARWCARCTSRSRASGWRSTLL